MPSHRPTLLLRLSTLALAWGLAGCAGDAPDPPAPRLVVLAPALAEMLEALDLDSSIVGVGEAGPWPAALQPLPSVGRFDRPDVERVLEVGATHIVTTRSAAAQDALEALRRVGVEPVALDTSTYTGVLSSLRALGERFDRAEAAARTVETLDRQLDAVRRRVAGRTRRPVAVVVGREPLFVAGPGSHLDELVEVAGGVNVFADLERPYAQASLEVLIERAPDVLVDLSGDPAAAERWRVLLPAATEVHVVAPSELSIPGIRLGEMAARLEGLLHPATAGTRVEPRRDGA